MSVMHTEMDKNDELRMEWDPFTDDQVEGLFFPGAGRGELAEQLLHLLRYGSSLTLLVGSPGVGKRNLLVHVLTQIDRDLFDIAVIDAHVMLDFAQLLSQLDDPWRSLRPFTPDNYLELVPAVASAADEESKTLVCVLVGAQQLSEAVLGHLQAMLSASAGLPVKCLLLVDGAELEAVPTMRGLVEALPETAVLYLDPLDLEQTREYLQYRMHTAGLGQVRFNDEQVERIYRAGGGVIARTNAAARELLLEAMPAAAKASQKKAGLPWMHIGALGLAVVVLLVLFVSQPDSEAPAPVAETNTVVLDNPVQPLSEPATEQTPFAEVARVAAESVPASSAVEQTAVVPTDSGLYAPVGAAVETVGEDVAGQAAAVVPVPDMQTPPAISEPASGSAAAVPPQPAPAATAQTPDPVAPVQAKPEAVKPPAPAVSVAKSAAPAPKPAVTESRASWLLSLPKDHYVLQLLGAQEEATVKRFLSQYPSLRKVTYYKTWRQAKPWYVVVQGDYPSHEAAKAAIATLPASLQQQNPWIRKVDLVVKEIPGR